MMQPIEETAALAQAAIEEEFAFFGDWSERYQYLIDLGRRLPEFPEEWKTEENRLLGCQSKVWIVPHVQDGKLFFSAISDSSIVSGLVYMALAGLLRTRQTGNPEHRAGLRAGHRPDQAFIADPQQRLHRPA